MLILDSSNLLYRIFWAWKDKDEITGDNNLLVYTFLNCVKSYVTKYRPDVIYAAWDRKLDWPSTNFRKDMISVEYKGTRDYSETKKLHDKDDEIMEMLGYLGVKNMYPKVMEADDVISWICKKEIGEKVIVSSDQDMWQLIDSNTSVYNPIRKIEINKHNFKHYANVSRNHFVVYKSFLGDASDNISGVRGIGKVRARRLLEDWPRSKDTLTEKQQLHLDRNIKLIDLTYGYTVHAGEEDCYRSQFDDLKGLDTDFSKFKKRSQALELHSFTSKVSTWEELFGGKRMVDGVNSLIERLGLNK